MSCLLDFQENLMVFPVLGIAAATALVLVWLLRYTTFEGKRDFSIAAIALIWWLLFVAREFTAVGAECKMIYATFEWPGIVLLPVAWSFFVSTYLRGTPWFGERFRRVVLTALPALAIGFAATNPWHHLFYTSATVLDASGSHISYDHGILFFVMVALVYPFPIATLVLILSSFRDAHPRVWFFLIALGVASLAPFVVNAAYVFTDFSYGGYDPTPSTFAIVMMIFSWLLANNRMMDTVALGRDVLYYTAREPILITDTDARVLAANEAGCATLFDPPEPARIEGAAPVGPVAAFLATLDDSVTELRGGSVEIGDKIFEPRAVRVSGPIRQSDRNLGWTISFIDITEREMRTQVLRQALADAQAAIEAKDEFIAVASHELRTPMTSLRGGVDLMLSGMLGEMPESSLQILHLLRRNGDRLSQLIETLLDLRSLETEELVLNARPTNLSQLLDEAIGEHRIIASAQGVVLDIGGERFEECIILDGLRVRQVIDNLLTNAVKFSEPGGRVCCSVAARDRWVRISVADEGIGIPEGSEEVVFGKFSQLDRGSTRKADGLGLGMNISRELAWKLGGELTYVSGPGPGTVFHLDLPRDLHVDS